MLALKPSSSRLMVELWPRKAPWGLAHKCTSFFLYHELPTLLVQRNLRIGIQVAKGLVWHLKIASNIYLTVYHSQAQHLIAYALKYQWNNRPHVVSSTTVIGHLRKRPSIFIPTGSGSTHSWFGRGSELCDVIVAWVRLKLFERT